MAFMLQDPSLSVLIFTKNLHQQPQKTLYNSKFEDGFMNFKWIVHCIVWALKFIAEKCYM